MAVLVSLNTVYVSHFTLLSRTLALMFHSASMFPGTLILPAGLFITGWTARADVHWIAPDIGIALIGAGVILNFQAIQTYVIDAFTLHAASALAAVAFLRSLCGFGFPLFAPASAPFPAVLRKTHIVCRRCTLHLATAKATRSLAPLLL